MCDDDSVIWPSTLPPCPVAASIVTAMQIAMAQKIDEAWYKPVYADGFEFKKIDWSKPPEPRGDEPTLWGLPGE